MKWAYWTLALLVPPVIFWLLRQPGPMAERSSRNEARPETNHGLVILIALFLFLYVGAEVSFGSWLYTYALALKLSNEAGAAYLVSGFWGALTIGRLLAIPLAVRFQPRAILLGDLIGCLVSCGIMLLWLDSRVAIWIGACGLGFSMASIFPTLFAFAARRLVVTGRITGWFMVGASAGSMLLPWLTGQLFESIGSRAMLLIVTAAMTTAVFIFGAIIRGQDLTKRTTNR